ncbi:MAG TPA: radical SAM protein, partial [Clostridia bacterium]|nr:radical SAM protein [Clostridia bacterium]
ESQKFASSSYSSDLYVCWPNNKEDKNLNQILVSSSSLVDFPLWDRMKEKNRVLAFSLELTARCNNNCSHCYINLPADDLAAKEKELNYEEIMKIADQAIEMGALWCTITGGEPLLRNDFKEIYLGLKRKGLIVSVFTNATLIKEEHIELFKKYPPRDIEVTVYGVTSETYEAVTRRPGSFKAFIHGLNLLLQSGIKVRLKAMVIRSNFKELPQIAKFCRERTKDYFLFDPLLHLRYDRNSARNKEIKSERLTPQEIVAIEMADIDKLRLLEKACDKLKNFENSNLASGKIFTCGTGIGSFDICFDGSMRLCTTLGHPHCVYNLRKGSLADAWQNFVPKIRDMRSSKEEFLTTCRICPIRSLCGWCPATAHLETGELDSWTEYFCQVAHERAKALGYENNKDFLDFKK